MHVSASPPLAVGKLVWRPRPDAFVMTIVCKATYALRNGPCQLLDTPDQPAQVDVYAQDASSRSFCVPNDFAPFKRYVDVMLVGHAWAPHGKAVPSLVARFAVGTVNKAIAVYGDRFWLPDGRPSAPVPFTKMPLRWSRAAGGPTSWNPVGIAPSIDATAPRQLPNLEPVSLVHRGPMQEIPPVGFGPIAPQWPTRVEHLRMHRAAWSHEAWHEQPLPAGVDASYFNAAPGDQQIVELPARTQIVLEHMNPEAPLLNAIIEDVRPRALVTKQGGAPQEVWLRADTLLVDVDRGICNVTWRAAVPLRHPQEEGVVVVTPTHVRTAPSATPSAATMPQRPKPPPTMPMLGNAPPKAAPTLPFARASIPSAPPSEPRRQQPSRSLLVDEETTQTGSANKPAGSSPLPFQSSPLRADPVSERVTPTPTPIPEQKPARSATLPFIESSALDEDDVTLPPVPQQKPAAASALPFVKAPIAEDDAAKGASLAAQQAAPSALPFVRAPLALDDAAKGAPRAAQRAALSALPFRPPEPDPAADEPEPETERKPNIQGEPVMPFVQPTPAAQPLLRLSAPSAPAVIPAPPAFSAALPFSASLDRPAALPFSAPPTTAAAPVIAAPASDSREPPPVPPGQANEPKSPLSIEQYARIKAALWGAHDALHEVLARYGIDEVAWRVHERQQAETLAGEAREGRCDLALALCAAFEAAKAPGVAPPPLGGLP